ncbi:hypothetical protein J3F84DRAFT_402055 [Trichoderma pleuroticola]
MENYSISSSSFENNVKIHQGNKYYASEPPQSKSDACRNALFLADPIVDRENLKSTKGQRTASTCEWIRDNETYQSWLDGDVQCLWITGGPGKGKTMLSIFLTEELERRTQENKATELLLFYFCAPDEKHSSALVRMRPNLKTQETMNSPNALWMVLEKLLKAPDLGTCDEESSSLLVDKFYEYFLQTIVSRKIDLLDAFPQVKLDPDNNEYVNSDIQNFIASSVKRLERIRGFNDIRENIEATLLDRAQGTFLWIGFVMAELSRKRTCTQIMETLEGIPKGLHRIYSRMLAQIEVSRRSVIFDILQWVTVAVRPLTISELSEAIHLPSTAKISKEQAILDHITLFSLVHQSARDYLLQSDADSDPMLKEFQIQAEHAHATLAEVCLDYIEKSDLRNTPLDMKDASVLQKSPLLEYATMHWPDHARCCSDADDKNPLRLSRPLFQETSSMRNHWYIFWRNEHPSLLHMASYFGIYELVRELLMTNTLLRTPPAVNETLNGVDDTMPLSLAARGGHMAIVQLLLTNGADGKDTALQEAAYEGHMAIVQLLLTNGADSKDMVLQLATDPSHIPYKLLLIANGADNSDDEILQRAAARRGHTAIVQLLLVNGADGKDKALRLAVREGHTAIVQLLLANGANGDLA